jgi:hypothetical protein
MVGLHEYLSAIHPTDAKRYFATSLTFGEMVSAMDQFYKEAVNAPIPLLFSQVVVVFKANGGSEAEYLDSVESLRKVAASPKKP